MLQIQTFIPPPLLPLRLRVAVRVAAAIALISLALEFGFHIPPVPVWLLVVVQGLAVALYLFSRGYAVAVSQQRLRTLGRYWLDLLLLLLTTLVIVFLGVARPLLKLSALYIAVMQGAIAARLLIELVHLNLSLSKSKLHPARLMALAFGGLALTGALALALPRATEPHVWQQPDFSIGRHLLDCLFTSVSATCVTGLVVYDTGGDFTVIGQSIILVLIQLGGLGIMVFGGLFGLLVGRQLSLRQSLTLQDTLSHQTLGQMRRMIWFILGSTFVIEAVGAVVLYPMWHDVDGVSLRVFHSVFHAVSAFCNAGFALRADSLIAYQRVWQVYLVMLPLIVIGGLGFPVLSDLWAALKTAIRARLRQSRSLTSEGAARKGHRFSLHTKLVLSTTALLIVVPVVAFTLFESSGVPERFDGRTPRAVMRESSWGGRVLDALFLSVTCRTAGFNTVDMGAETLSPETHTLSSILMFVGGSPASTAGGIKTVGLAVLCLGMWATLRGRKDVEAFGRTIPDTIVRRAAVIGLVMFALVGAVSLVLMYTESVSMREAVFESVSACGTVGLSTGLTPELTVVGRVVIVVAMFAGRLGPLTLLIALAGSVPSPRYEYPAESVGIG
jgi:trk system potassium uptake protein TrkH